MSVDWDNSKYFKASDQEIVPTLAELGKTAKDYMGDQ